MIFVAASALWASASAGNVQIQVLDRDGNVVANRYPQAQQEIDPATGRRSAVPAPEFEPPPGPVRSP